MLNAEEYTNRNINTISTRLLLHRYILKLFQELDVNRDGSLSTGEYMVLLGAFKKCTSTELERFFKEADSDDDNALRTSEFGTFLKLASPSLFDSSKRVINDDFEYFHQQLLAATPQTEYEEDDDGNAFEMVEHVPRPNDIPIKGVKDALRVLNMHARNVSILNQADLDGDQFANFSETLRLINCYEKIRNALNFLKLYAESELNDENKLDAKGLSSFIETIIEHCSDVTRRTTSGCETLKRHTLERKVTFNGIPSDGESLIALVLHTVPNTYFVRAINRTL
ncbi:hypothetical protein Tcan_08199 [Toxocara canis]|uniref:EF-hand domain-containing protein n=1 Tax=Toxocara canis TaxID=6265 RepID=A0A0B2VHN3_TOXCA|nr:hypothetical protein Tcan_08199 [Toxocara canis]